MCVVGVCPPEIRTHYFGRKSKLVDDDDDDMGMGMDAAPAVSSIKPTVAWRAPQLLPPNPDAPPPQVNSSEIATQASRTTSVRAARYSSERDVPNSPAPLSDVEQALDMTSQSSTVVQPIPFFVPQAPSAPAPAPAVQAAPMSSNSYSHMSSGVPTSNNNVGMGVPPPPQPSSSGASAEVVQSLGLPMFLVGQNPQALRTLASTPSLLSTFVDSNGMYDQARLTSLVQTLTQNITPSQQAPQSAVGYQQNTTTYGASGGGQSYSSSSGGIYGPASTGQAYGGVAANGGYRGDQNSTDGANLHLGGYGASTTQTDIINLFAPYVKVDEVVMKGTFCFVNTSDALGAKRAREALNGALLGGQPVRINIAQRKNRDAAVAAQPKSFSSNTGSYYGNNGGIALMGSAPAVSVQAQGQGADYSNVRDDRGNPATKNLFVAGYGPGTNEAQIQGLFAQHATITGIILKGTFSFVNTDSKESAIHCREVLSGSMLNGGVLRINFAKETGRLGTSFDLTYGNKAGGRGGGGGSHSHYGRGGY